MKNLIFGLTCLISLNLNAQKMSNIQETIHKLFVATDQQDWEGVAECFTGQVLLDYSSMTGQLASETTPHQITESWKSILPGFQHTHHQIGNFTGHINGETANAFCYGTATHYLENEHKKVWTVVGTYDFELRKVQADWKISGMKFNFKYQTGNLELPQLAIRRLNSKAIPPSTAEKNKQTVAQFFKALEKEDIEGLVSLFAENGKHINPYHSGLFPKGAEGKEHIRAYWAPVFPNFEGMEFPIEELYAMENPNWIYVKFKGIIQLKNNEGDYKNDYYAIFKFNTEGAITEYIEIFNPITAARGFGLLDQIK